MGQRVRALDAIRRAAAISNSVELRREAVAALALPDLRFEQALPLGQEFTLKLLDSAFEQVAVCRGTGPLEIRRLPDLRVMVALQASTNLPAYVAWWSSDRRYLALKRDLVPGGERADLEVWEIPNQRRIMVLHDLVNNAAAFHPRQARLLATQAGEGVLTWDLDKFGQARRLPLATFPIRLEFSPDGERFAAVERSAGAFTVSVYDYTTGVRRASHVFTEPVMALGWHPAGHRLAVADYAGTIHLMDPETGQTRALGSHKAQAVTVAFSPDGNYLFSGGWEGELIAWDTRTSQRALVIGRGSWSVQFQRDGETCALIRASDVELHHLVRPEYRGFAEDLGPRLRNAVFSPDNRWLAAAADQHLGVWDLTTAAPGALAQGGDEQRPSFSLDGRDLFASGNGAPCSHWRLLPGTNAASAPILEPREVPPLDQCTSVCLANDVITFTGPAGSAVTNLEYFRTDRLRWESTINGINGVSPDGQWLAIFRPFTRLLHVYRLPAIEPVATLTNQASIRDFVFSPAGDELAIASRAGIELWATNGWHRTRFLTNFTAMRFCPQGSLGWLTSDYRRAGLYDVRTLEPVLPLPAGTLPLAISPDGHLLAVSVNARYLQVWNLEEVRGQLRDFGLDW